MFNLKYPFHLSLAALQNFGLMVLCVFHCFIPYSIHRFNVMVFSMVALGSEQSSTPVLRHAHPASGLVSFILLHPCLSVHENIVIVSLLVLSEHAL